MATTTTIGVDLKLRKEYIDSNFDGYKLSLDPCPVYKVGLTKKPEDVKLNDDQYSYQHVKTFATQNHLFDDPYDLNSVYYISEDLCLMQIKVESGHNICNPETVFEIPQSSKVNLCASRLSACVHFLNAEWVLISDGSGKLSLIWTGQRENGLIWKVCFSGEPLDEATPFNIKDGLMRVKNDMHIIDCLVLQIEAVDKTDKYSSHQTVIEWLTLTSSDQSNWTLSRSRRLIGAGPINYASLQSDGTAIYIASEKKFKMTYDSLKPVVEVINDPPVEELPLYTWSQTMEFITIQITQPEPFEKDKILYKVTATSIEVAVLGNNPILQGQLHSLIDVEESTWAIQNNSLEINLAKKEQTMWQEVIVGDTRGKLVVDSDVAAKIHERLAHLTSETMVTEDEKKENVFNSQQLEDCDFYPDASSAIIRVDGETHSITHQANLGSHQWLFNTRLTDQRIPALCIRHDVDGIIWQPQECIIDNAPWIHTGTFNALGYVKASKQQNKFSTCSQNLSFAALCDSTRHIYVYRQSSPTITPLRNRKTGKQIGAIAKQQLITLNCTNEILGMIAAKDRLYVLTCEVLYMAQVIEQS